MQMQQMALVIALLAVGMIVLELIKLRRPVPPDYVQQALEQAVDPQRCARFLIRGYTVSYVLLLVAAYLFVEGYAIFCRFKLEKEI